MKTNKSRVITGLYNYDGEGHHDLSWKVVKGGFIFALVLVLICMLAWLYRLEKRVDDAVKDARMTHGCIKTLLDQLDVINWMDDPKASVCIRKPKSHKR